MAMRLEAWQRQWIDLGRQLEPCLPRPTTCRPPGATVALWVKVEAPGQFPGIISSRRTDSARGFQIGQTNAGDLV